MSTQTTVRATGSEAPRGATPPGTPCIIVIFGASGDLTKRLLMPAFYNLACDGLLPREFAIVGIALDKMSTEEFRNRMTADIKLFSTRKTFDEAVWNDLVGRFYYTSGDFGDLATFNKLAELVAKADAEHQAQGNIIFYMAVPPAIFGLISDNIDKAGFKKRAKGWLRIIAEKPFGTDLASALALNREMLARWSEDQIYRIDHYLGKETVQNLLTFRFSNGIFEPLWNKNYIDHIQFTVTETVGVEGRGNYYDRSGVLRDMIQNHMFQMLAYLCMEPPVSFQADAVRNEKSKLLTALRVLKPEEVPMYTVRGQYGPGKKADGSPAVGYREEPDVNPQSGTETFAAMKILIDNWRWDGVPVYLRSGKALWKRGTEIIVQFKKAPEVIFRGTPAAEGLEANRLLFHVQPDQGIELRFHAKTPGPSMFLQKVNMRFDYKEAFEASRGTGYEVLLYNAMVGDATLFSRSDLVETAWRVAQPLLDHWSATGPKEFPNYPAGSWGPKAAFELIERDGRKWVEVINRDVLAQVPLFKDGDQVFLQNLAMMLKPVVYGPGETVIKNGELGNEMYFICRGKVEVVGDGDKVVSTMGEGSFFGEIALLLSRPRMATIRTLTPCDLFVLDKADFTSVLKDHPDFAKSLAKIAHERYHLSSDTGA
ncbi:MAG: glucose-6-phosphate dehydrogenase [Gemmataceae bacterium]|nr:glucose-6-phosphate dehydrogenase [Gemmataceae bacterium]